jgi:hypothetical protein
MALTTVNNEFGLDSLFVDAEGYQSLVKLLNELKVKTVLVQFSGGGDSGQIDCIEFYDMDLDTFQGSWKEKQTHVLSVGDVTVEEKAVLKPREWAPKHDRTLSLRKVFDELTGNALDLSGLDWYNNDGGQGEMVFTVTPDALVADLSVGINYMETEDYGFRFQNFSGTGEEE